MLRNKSRKNSNNTFFPSYLISIYEKHSGVSAAGWGKHCIVEGLMAVFHQMEIIKKGMTYIV